MDGRQCAVTLIQNCPYLPWKKVFECGNLGMVREVTYRLQQLISMMMRANRAWPDLCVQPGIRSTEYAICCLGTSFSLTCGRKFQSAYSKYIINTWLYLLPCLTISMLRKVFYWFYITARKDKRKQLRFRWEKKLHKVFLSSIRVRRKSAAPDSVLFLTIPSNLR